MLSGEMNERLTRVGPGTPAGELLRRYWMPIAPKAEVDELRIRPGRLLGEDNGVAGANGVDAANGWERPTRNQAEAPSLATARAEREAALAERARLDLDEKLAGLLVRAEVLEAFEETLQVLRRQLSDLVPRLAEKLATVGNAKEAQALMETEFRGLLEKCAAELDGWGAE